jgi:hypothetical protein
LEDASRLRLRSKVDRIADFEVKGLLGTFYRPGEPCFWVPDTPFPEATIISAARDRARDRGAALYDLEYPVSLVDEPSASGGLLVKVDEAVVESPIVVVAAGSGSPVLLDQLNLRHPLRVFQSPLCVVDRPPAMTLNVPLFCDCATGITVAYHDGSMFPPDGRLVIGNGHRRPLDNSLISCDRKIDDHDAASIADLLPGISLFELKQMKARFTAGRKTEPYHSGMHRSIEPWCQSFDEYPGLIAAVPVKATMALVTADTVMERIGAMSLKSSDGVPGKCVSSLSHLSTWEDTVHMHHESYYDRMNDAVLSTDQSHTGN